MAKRKSNGYGKGCRFYKIAGKALYAVDDAQTFLESLCVETAV
ncbi:hypothetical protein [Desulfosarcina variabilis]